MPRMAVRRGIAHAQTRRTPCAGPAPHKSASKQRPRHERDSVRRARHPARRHRSSVLDRGVAEVQEMPAVGGAVGEGTKEERADSTHAKVHVDETLVWNNVMLDAIIASTLGNPPTIRMAATVNSAMFDAQNGVGRQRYRPIFVTDRAPHETDARAAVVQAAYVTFSAASSGVSTSPTKSWRGARAMASATRRPSLPAPVQASASGNQQPVPACRPATSPSRPRSC